MTTERPDSSALWALAVTLLAVAAVAASLWVHPPSAYRTDQLDQRRGWDLQHLSTQIGAYWRSHRELPPTLDVLVGDQRINPRTLRDPETGAPHRYRILSKTSYLLCAAIAHPDQIREQHNLALVNDEGDQSLACYRYIVAQNGQ